MIVDLPERTGGTPSTKNPEYAVTAASTSGRTPKDIAEAHTSGAA